MNTNYTIVIILITSALLWNKVACLLFPKLGLIKDNFKKTPIVSSYGIVMFPYIAVFLFASYLLGFEKGSYVFPYLIYMTIMWVLGALDDVFGSREVGGFKGHFKKLFVEKKITTGAIKAIGGGIAGILAGLQLYDGNLLKFLAIFLIIPATANTINILDLRPGRAAAVFFFGIAVTCIVVAGNFKAPVAVLIISFIAFIFAIIDSRGKAMMGDSGSNALGASLGLTIIFTNNIYYIFTAIMISAILQIYSEKNSISALVEGNSLLRRIDRHLGVR